MKTKKVKQSITIDVSNLEKGYQDIKDQIVNLRLELSSLDTTLFEFQEIYEALVEKRQEPVAPALESLNEQVQDLHEQIDNRLIKNLQYSLDNRD